MNSFALTVHDAVKTYPGGASPVLNGVSLSLEPGESFVILGATGSRQVHAVTLGGGPGNPGFRVGSPRREFGDGLPAGGAAAVAERAR